MAFRQFFRMNFVLSHELIMHDFGALSIYATAVRRT